MPFVIEDLLNSFKITPAFIYFFSNPKSAFLIICKLSFVGYGNCNLIEFEYCFFSFVKIIS